MQKLLFLALCAVVALFQYELWFGRGGIYDSNRLKNTITQQVKINQELQNRNDEVIDHLQELKGSPELMEARARAELNLVKPNETLVLLPNQNESLAK
ncbi:MAG: septum formation initiator family protein [Burkholderiales bacterium]|jgi:cell division protein FtsB|nr:septum formation initiator family protein [Burkholderiales bacterium]